MRYRHAFRVAAPLTEVAEFHRRRDSLAAITPPPVRLRVAQAPEVLAEGDQMAMVLQLGPLSLPWLARIEAVAPTGFVDRQLAGPFERWVHRHTFRSLGAEATLVEDEVRAVPRRHPVWGPFGLGMWLSLPLLFAYRARQTRRLLERAR